MEQRSAQTHGSVACRPADNFLGRLFGFGLGPLDQSLDFGADFCYR
jgi:hypothetical protein